MSIFVYLRKFYTYFFKIIDHFIHMIAGDHSKPFQ